MANKFPTTFHAPTEFTLAVLAGKWKTVILCYLTHRPRRYSDLRRLVPDLSDKVLTERLRDLVALGLVTHRKGDERTSSDIYALAPRGRSLSKILHLLREWGMENAAEFHVKISDPLEMLNRDSPAVDRSRGSTTNVAACRRAARQSSVRRKRRTAMIMAISIRPASINVSTCRSGSVDPLSMIDRTMRR